MIYPVLRKFFRLPSAHFTLLAMALLARDRPARAASFEEGESAFLGHKQVIIEEIHGRVADLTDDEGRELKRVLLTRLAHIPEKIRGYELNQDVMLGHRQVVISILYPDGTADVVDNDSGKTTPSVAVTRLHPIVEKIDGYEVDDFARRGHQTYRVTAVYWDHTVDLESDFHTLPAEPTRLLQHYIEEIDGFKEGEYAVLGHFTYRIIAAYSDHTVDLEDEAEEVHRLPATPTRKLRRDADYLNANSDSVAEEKPEKKPSRNSRSQSGESSAAKHGARGEKAVSAVPAVWSAPPVKAHPKTPELLETPELTEPTIGASVTPSAPFEAAASALEGEMRIAAHRLDQPAPRPSSATAPAVLPTGEIVEINRSAPAYRKLSTVIFPDALSNRPDPNVIAMTQEITQCGLSIAGPACLDGRFHSQDKKWIAEVSTGNDFYFVHGFGDTEEDGKLFLIVYHSQSEGAAEGFTSAFIYAAPDTNQGLSAAYGLFSPSAGHATPLISLSLPADPARSALEIIHSSTDPVKTYHALSSLLESGDISIMAPALDYATAHLPEYKASATSLYQQALLDLFERTKQALIQAAPGNVGANHE